MSYECGRYMPVRKHSHPEMDVTVGFSNHIRQRGIGRMLLLYNGPPQLPRAEFNKGPENEKRVFLK